ncbi:MAG: InlB B-repeat-containing protein, partial [Gammaproteobacteria bacterium]|nr:InlB B-repeat-containing protein [Gammaproteobacteria bacterium]
MGGDEVTDATIVATAGDHILYAHWTANTYTVTLDLQGGGGGDTSVNATYDAAMPVATGPTRAGYSFAGYFTQIDGGGIQYYTAAMASARNWDIANSTTTLYAQWLLVEPPPVVSLL